LPVASALTYSLRVPRVLPDGSLILRGSVINAAAPAGADSTGLVILQRAGGQRTLAHFGGTPIVPDFEPGGVQAASDSLVFSAPNVNSAIHILDFNGRILDSTRKVLPQRRLIDADIKEYKRQVRRDAAGVMSPDDIEAQFKRTRFPEFLKPYEMLIADDDGNAWALHSVTSSKSVFRWSVFSPTGEAIAEITMPSVFLPWQIGKDYVLGRWHDGDGVPHVRAYSLNRR
jgi:hypothetical protein